MEKSTGTLLAEVQLGVRGSSPRRGEVLTYKSPRGNWCLLVDFIPVEANEELVDHDPRVCAEMEPRPFSI